MSLDIGKAMGLGSVGDSSGWAMGVAQASIPVTNLAPHVDGGQHSASGNRVSSADAVRTMHWSAATVLGALALLWLMGGFVFKSARL
jgi:hypothetical protein